MHKADLEKASMEIILHAGNARTYIMDALECCINDKSEESKRLFAEAKQSVTLAHRVQTEVIQSMISKHNEYSILFSHAQDTLMSIMTEVNLAEKMILMYNKLIDRS